MPKVPDSKISPIEFNTVAFMQATNNLGLSELTNERKLSQSYQNYKELITTEISYINSLEFLLTRQEAILKAHHELLAKNSEPNLINAQSLHHFFQLIKALRDKHRELLEALYEPNPQSWATQISQLQELSKQYMVFFEQNKNAKYPNELDIALRDVRGMSLSSYLIMPVQRPPRYVLFFNELTRQIENESVNFEQTDALKTARDAAQTLANAGNQAIDEWLALQAVQPLVDRLNQELDKGRKADISLLNGLENIIGLMKKEKTHSLENALAKHVVIMSEKQAKTLSRALSKLDNQAKKNLDVGNNIHEILSRAQYSPIIKSSNGKQAIQRYQDRASTGHSVSFDKSTQKNVRSHLKKHPVHLTFSDNFEGGAEQLLDEVSKAAEHGFKVMFDDSAILALKKYSESNRIMVPARNVSANPFDAKKTLDLATTLAVMNIPVVLDEKTQKYFDSLEKMPPKKLSGSERELLREKQELQALLGSLNTKPVWERAQPMQLNRLSEDQKRISNELLRAEQRSKPGMRNT